METIEEKKSESMTIEAISECVEPAKELTGEAETAKEEITEESAEDAENCEEKISEDLQTESNKIATIESVQSRLNRMLAEAEARGRLQGRNEAIAEIMNAAGTYERPGARTQTGDNSADSSTEFTLLSNLRRSVWD